MSNYKQKDSEVGALWKKTGPNGEYFTGTIMGENVVVFRNRLKEPGDRKPDWRVLKSKPLSKDRPSDDSVPF